MDYPYRFTISESYTPATIPMSRLAEYIAALAKLLGEPGNVHLDKIEHGSVRLVARIDEPAKPKVRDRIHAVRTGTAPVDAMKAFRALDAMLEQDNAVGALSSEGDPVVVSFPGKRRPKPIEFGPFKQEGFLDGEVHRIGGKDETKHIGIRDGEIDYSVLETTKAVAVRLASHLFGPKIRFFGTGTWFRDGAGEWSVRLFKVADFEVLDETPLVEVVDRLRAATGRDLIGVTPAMLLQDRHEEEPSG